MFESSLTGRVRVALAAAVLSALLGCAVNPVTGERELALVSEEQEIAMGREAAQQVESTMGLVDDAELQSYVSDIGQRLARDSERPDLPWAFHVVDESTPNAFALPGGYIFVTRGLMALLNSEAELAAVLGHEIGHVTARHSVNQISRAQLAQLGLGIGVIAAPETIGRFGDLASTGLGLLFLKYGRDDERQADDLGFDYMTAHGYDAREMEDVFATLDAASQLAGASPVPTWLASHPSGSERVEASRERVANTPDAALPDTRNESAYLSRIEGLGYGPDPRQGYFEGDAFYHPDLAFEFTVPETWNRQNLSSAVVAGSPEQDAALQLTLAQGDLRAAAVQFLSAEGVTEIASDDQRINGRPAIVSEFAAQTEQGTLRGLAAHIEYGGNVYRLITYAPDGRFDANSRQLARIVESFAPVRDSSVLDVEPNRIRIVEVDEPMSLEEFDRRYPSAVPLEELAVINQLEGADARLPEGTRAKQVVG